MLSTDRPRTLGYAGRMSEAAHGPGWRSSLPFTHERIGAVAIYCSDGRYNEQFDEFLHSELGLPRYDRLVIPGGAGCLAGHIAAYREEEVLSEQLRFLIQTHGLSRVVLIAHEACGFHLKRLYTPESALRARQAEDLAKAAARIRELATGIAVEAYHAGVQASGVRIDPVPV